MTPCLKEKKEKKRKKKERKERRKERGKKTENRNRGTEVTTGVTQRNGAKPSVRTGFTSWG